MYLDKTLETLLNLEKVFIQRVRRIKTSPADCHSSCVATDRKVPSLIILVSSYGKTKICHQFLFLNKANQTVHMLEGPETQGCFVYDFNKKNTFFF